MSVREGSGTVCVGVGVGVGVSGWVRSLRKREYKVINEVILWYAGVQPAK